MVEVRVTYETLFDLLRKEKSRNELQELEQSFFQDVVIYLKEKHDMLEKPGISTSRAEQEKIRIQIKNTRRILKELYELREKKILNLSMNKVRTGSELIDTSKMLIEEKKLFDDAVVLLNGFKKSILSKINDLESVPVETQKEPEVVEESKPVEEESSSSTKVKFLSDLPKFMGMDKKIYGPYEKNSVSELPSDVVNLLMKKGRIEIIS